MPDEMSFALSVTAKRLDLDTALDSASVTTDRVLRTLEQYGVREADVQTTGLSMYPEYDYPDYGPPVLTGYRVTQRASVRIRDLTQGGAAIGAAVESGGNAVRVRGIRLEIGDPDAVVGKARDKAVAEATRKAQQYAAATGQSLGDVVSIREVGSGARGGYRDQGHTQYRAYSTAADLKAVPVRAGKDDLEVRVEVVWAFE